MNRRNNRLWQKKGKSIIRHAKRAFEEQVANSTKTNNKNAFNTSRAESQPEKQLGLWITKELWDCYREDGEMTEKLNTFFASVFTMENMGHVPVSQPLLPGRESEELMKMKMTTDEVLDLLWKLKTN